MPTRQIAVVTDVTCRALGVDFDPASAAADVRRNGVVPASLDEFVGQLAEVAARGEVTLLARDAEALKELRAAGRLAA